MATPTSSRAMHEQIDRLAYAHTSFFTTAVAEALADHLIAHAPRRHVARLSRVRRLGGDRGGAETRAPVFRRDRRAAAAALHRPAPELSRQHAGRARGRRQRVAARAVRAAADRRHARVAVLRIPRPPRGRIAGGVWRASRAGNRRRDRAARPAQRHRLRRRTRRRRDARAQRRRCPAISGASGRSAIATASC